MTTLELTQATAMAIDQAISLIISENKIDEAIMKLNEAKICTDTMEKMINPPAVREPIAETTLLKAISNMFDVPENEIFTKSRKRERCSARQAYVYVLMKTLVKGKGGIPGSSKMYRHMGWDHSTNLYTCKVVQNYMDTEVSFREKIFELQNGLVSGKIEYPNLNQYIGWK